MTNLFKALPLILSFSVLFFASCGHNVRTRKSAGTMPASEKTTPPNRGESSTTSQESKRLRIAVMGFSAQGVSKSLADRVAELIRIEMVNTGRFTVIERSRLDVIIKEHGLQRSGCTDESCAVRIGRLLAANKMLIGTVMRLGGLIVITSRLVDVEKGSVEFAAKQDAKKEDDLYTATGLLTKKLTGRIIAKHRTRGETVTTGPDLRGKSFHRADLRGENLVGANMKGVNLYEAKLDGANLAGANLVGANLHSADLENTNLAGANLQRANLQRANLRGANLDGARLKGANLFRARIDRRWRMHIMRQGASNYRFVKWK